MINLSRRGFIFGLGASIAVARVAPLMRLRPELIVPELTFYFTTENCFLKPRPLNEYSLRVLEPIMSRLAGDIVENLWRAPTHTIPFLTESP